MGWGVSLAGAAAALATFLALRAGIPPTTREVGLGPGPALRAALAEEDARASAAALAAVAASWPVIADHALRLEIEARLRAGDAEGAALRARVFAGSQPRSPLAPVVAALRGEALEQLGQPAESLHAFRDALAESHEPSQRNPLRLRVAEAELAAGRPEAARSFLVALWTDAPESDPAARAEELLAAGERAKRLAPRSAEEWTRRAEGLGRAGRHDEAVHAFERALAAGLSRARASRVRSDRARALFRARRYPEAVAAFEALGDDPEPRFWRARSLARSGRIEASVAAFETLGRSRSALGWRSRYLAATLLVDDEASAARAVAHWEAVAARAPDAGLRRDARWRLGWRDFRSGRLEAARSGFASLAGAEPDEIGRLRARYWEARAGEGADGSSRAADFAALAGEYPLTYYGWRAALRVPSAALVGAARAPEAPLATTFRPSELARPRILLEAGLHDEAAAEVGRLAPRARGLGDRLLLASLASDAGRPSRARSLAATGLEVELARGPLPHREELWWHAWPRPWAGAVEAASERQGIPPELVWALMREESGFRHEVVSPVGARGLMQLMPATAASVAGELGLAAPAPGDLFDPGLNVRLGTRLLGTLTLRFPGRLSAAVGGYNAGAAAVTRWLRAHPGLEDDVFVEAIPYGETRGYVRRVLRSLHAYRVLY